MLLLTAWAAAPAFGRDIFVDNVAGDNARLGVRPRELGELNGPVRTIARALQLANGEDRIVLAKTGVPYRESISLVGGAHSGSREQPFVIEGNGCILEGAAPVPVELWEHDRGEVFRFRPARMAYNQLFLGGRPLKFIRPASHAGLPPKLQPLEWSLCGGYIYFCVEPGKLPGDYPLWAPAERVGITLYEVHDVVIRDLTVQGFSLDGISVFDGVRDCVLASVTCRGNGRSGIAVANASKVRVVDALLGDNLLAQLLTEGLSVTSVEESDLLSHVAPAIVRRGGTVVVDGTPFTGD